MKRTISKLLVGLLIIQLTFSCQSHDPEIISIGDRQTIYSKVLDEDREVYIHTPEGYEQMKNMPLVFVLDAYSQFNQTVSTIDYISNGTQGNDIIPSSIVVGITSPNRNHDFTPVKGMIGMDSISISNTGGAAGFLEFITTELIPYLDSQYNTCNHRTLIGHSLGGLFVFHAVLEGREYFDNYVAIDPAIGFSHQKYYNEILDTLRTSDLSNEQLYFAYADNRPAGMTDEALDLTTHQFLENIDKTTRDFYYRAESENWRINLTKKFYPKENHYSIPFRVTYDAMRHFYSYYQFDDMNNLFYATDGSKKDLVPKLKSHYTNISDKIGCDIKPQEGYINSWAWGYGETDIDVAAEMFSYNIDLYPASPTAYSYYARFLQREGQYKRALELCEKSLEIENDENVVALKRDIVGEIGEENGRE